MAGKEIVTKLTLDNSSVKKALSETEKTVLKFSAVIAGISSSMAAAAVYTAQWQDTMAKSARTAGVGVETFSALSVAAEKSNVSTEELSKTLGKLNTTTPELTKNLNSVGVSVRNTNGQLKTADVLLGDVAETMKKYKNPADQAAVATKVFGEEGGKLVSLLKDGKDGLAAARIEAEKYGLVVSEKAAAAAEKFNDDMTETKNSLKGLVSSLGESAIEWANQGGIMNVVRDTIATVTQLWRGLSAETKSAIITTIAVGTALAGVVTAIIAINAILPTLKVAMATAFGPVGLILMAVVAAISAVVYSVAKFGSQITEVFAPLSGTWATIKGAFESIGTAMANMTTNVGDVGAKFDEAGDGARRAAEPVSYFGTAVKALFASLATVINFVLTATQSIAASLSNEIDRIGISIDIMKAAVTGNFDEVKRLRDVAMKSQKDDLAEQTALWNKFGSDTEKMFSNLVVRVGKTPVKINPPKIDKKAFDEVKASYTALGFDITQKTTQTVMRNGVIVSNGVTQYKSATMTMADHTKKAVDEIIGYFSGIGGAVKAVTAAVTGASKYNTAVQLRDLEVLEIRSKKAYDDMRAAAEAEEAAKTAALEKSYDDQINMIKDAEAAKTAAIEFESKQRLLLNDLEYQTAKTQAEEAHAAFMEAERMRFESEKMLMDEKTVDKEQRRLNESVMDANWQAYVKAQEDLLQKQLADLAKNSGDKKTQIESSTKAKITGITSTNAEQVKALEIAKAAALAKNEEEKNKRMATIDAERTAQEKAEEKKRLQISYDAEVQDFQQTKAMKIIDVTVAGIAAAASAFGSMAALGPFGLAIGAGLAATIIGATAASVSQISSQNPVKPAALLAEDGGLLSGPRHAQGGIPVNAEGGELITSRGRTKALFDAMDSGGMGGVNINVNIGDGAIQAVGLDGSALAEMIGDMVSEKVGNEVRRLGIVGA